MRAEEAETEKWNASFRQVDEARKAREGAKEKPGIAEALSGIPPKVEAPTGEEKFAPTKVSTRRLKEEQLSDQQIH